MTTTETSDRDESALPALLRQMVTDLTDPQWYYWLHSNYFDIQSPTEREHTRWWQAALFLDYDALWNPAIETDALLIDVILKNKLPEERERIRIDFSQIWALKRFNKYQTVSSEEESTLYYDGTKLKMPPIHQQEA